MPFAWLCIPVRMTDRLGLHDGELQ